MTAMIHTLTEFFGQPLQQQFYWVSVVSCVAFCAAIVLREFCRADWCKGCGRLLGLGGFFLLFCYAVHATDVATRMERMANGNEYHRTDGEERRPASQIANINHHLQLPKTISVTTPGGNIIRFTSANGGSGLSRTADRSRCSDSRQAECGCGRCGGIECTGTKAGDSDGKRDHIAGASAGFTKLPDTTVMDLGRGF